MVKLKEDSPEKPEHAPEPKPFAKTNYHHSSSTRGETRIYRPGGIIVGHLIVPQWWHDHNKSFVQVNQ